MSDYKNVRFEKIPHTGIYLELESLKQEYQNQFDRSNKLDNKIYITITFLGFLFVFITGIFSGVNDVTFAFTWSNLPGMLYIFICVCLVLTYVYNLIFYMYLLRPEQIRRVDPENMKSLSLEEMQEEAAVLALIGLYRETVDENLEKLHKRCDKFTSRLRFVVLTVILAFLAYGMQIFLSMGL